MASPQIRELKTLDDRELAIFNAEFDRSRRSVLVAYLLLIFLGGLGAHQFYLGRWGLGLAYPILTVIGWTLAFGALLAVGAGSEPEVETATGSLVIGGGVLALVGMALLLDLITLPREVRKRDDRTRARILKAVRAR